jgi:NAD(P)-dependent dehydrogenase (short-subunit alcohol dehydrogenase family)
MNAAAMTGYGRMCGWTLARAHARAGDRIAIAAYLGGSDKFDQAVADFGETYADQTERGQGALADAVASGRMQAQTGI